MTIAQVAIETKRNFCKRIGDTLHIGTEDRSGLPLELVTRIFRLAGIAIPAPKFDQSIAAACYYNDALLTDHGL